MFVVVYAEETTTDNTIDLIEYDVVYTVTTVENVRTLNATFTLTNNESGTEEPLLIVAIYDNGRMIDVQSAHLNISSGATVSETLSIVIPSNMTENYYIKLFALEGTGSIRPLGNYTMIHDIDPYFWEKLVYVTASENAEFRIFMNASAVEGGNNDVVHTIEYDPTKVAPTDLCGFTYERELSAAVISNTNIVIESVDETNGIIKYHFSYDAGRNTGINNVIKFKALTSITDAEIKYTIQ